MPALTGPVVLGERTAPSRVLFGPIETNLARRREISDRHVAFYARRAAGGAGVVVTEVASVHPSDHPYERAPLAADAGAGWAAVAGACRPHGTLVVAGLGHAGAQGSSAYHRAALCAPSRVPDPVVREVPVPMEQPELDALVAGFAAATARAVGAGCDGVEIQAGQHALLRQFASGLTNTRDDVHGHDRTLLLREVLAAVRGALGSGVLGLRLCGDELAPWAGITPDDAVALAAEVDVDYLVPTRGGPFSVHATRPDLHTPPGFNRDLCARMRRVGQAATVLQGSVVDVAMAQAALDDGVADLVEMTRAQLADPDVVAHVRAGTPERIRPSTLSNARTAVRDPRNPIISDDAEPRTGYETVDPPVEGCDPHPRDVLVVGGGPAGLEAARVLALRGHRVRLAERARELGGALLLAAVVGGRSRMGVLVPWWCRELERLGVEIMLGTAIGPAGLDATTAGGAVVLLATGGRDGVREYPSDVPVLGAAAFAAHVRAAGLGESSVTAPRVATFGPASCDVRPGESCVVDAQVATFVPASGDVRLGESRVPARRVVRVEVPDGPVLVHDAVGDWTGAAVAEQLAASGRAVTIVTPDAVVAPQLADVAEVNARLQRAGVARALRSRLVRVAGGVAELEHVWTGERQAVPCALVVDCGHRLPDDALWRARPRLARAGDCVAPRTVHEAVREGRRAALALGARSPVPERSAVR